MSNNPMKRKPGRPTTERKTMRFITRCTPAEYAKFQELKQQLNNQKETTK